MNSSSEATAQLLSVILRRGIPVNHTRKINRAVPKISDNLRLLPLGIADMKRCSISCYISIH